ncbi:hypothetical protein TMPK1_29260 [Rhodospirillales bacterium TMPK1]|uniref:Uncharacterized protein n=2 Tax=Roseiterribacter gracilis TaxID=2812848 RepID=A0A8S8XFK3_9PROT|nr:hypothetical protein TMPK1_29260 [Rhodospirillales bacterium TMPK1]
MTQIAMRTPSLRVVHVGAAAMLSAFVCWLGTYAWGSANDGIPYLIGNTAVFGVIGAVVGRRWAAKHQRPFPFAAWALAVAVCLVVANHRKIENSYYAKQIEPILEKLQSDPAGAAAELESKSGPFAEFLRKAIGIGNESRAYFDGRYVPIMAGAETWLRPENLERPDVVSRYIAEIQQRRIALAELRADLPKIRDAAASRLDEAAEKLVNATGETALKSQFRNGFIQSFNRRAQGFDFDDQAMAVSAQILEFAGAAKPRRQGDKLIFASTAQAEQYNALLKKLDQLIGEQTRWQQSLAASSAK